MQKEAIAIIGSGLMGHGIAQIFALQGHSVCLYDINHTVLDKAAKAVEENLAALVGHGIISAQAAAIAPGRIHGSVALEEAAQADFILEAVPENMALKQDIFSQLDQMSSPQAILASNTSVMSITEIASKARYKERIVGTHFWNPPYLIPLVEVVQAQHSSLESVSKTIDLLRRVGKHPVHCRKDVPGFIGNRMQHALWREALHIVQEGIADAATVDETVRLSFGMRLPHLGPMENMDMVGLDLTLAIHDYIFPFLSTAQQPYPLVRDKVAASELGFKSGKGLRHWSQEEQDASRRALREYLLQMEAKR